MLRSIRGICVAIGLTAFAALGLAASGAAADEVAEVQEVRGLDSATSGIAVGPDGNVWAAEEFSGAVARISPAGRVLSQYPVGESPHGVAPGPGGTVWVAATGSRKMVWLDATAPSPAPHEAFLLTPECGPWALAPGDEEVYFSLPSVSGCNGGSSRIGWATGSSVATSSSRPSAGPTFGLAVAGGELFEADFYGDFVWRVNPSTLAAEVSIATPSGSGPNQLAVSPTGEVWATLTSANAVAHFPATKSGGNATVVPLAPGLLNEPVGIAFGPDAAAYVASRGNSSLVRIDSIGNATSFALPAHSEPNELAVGADGTVWISDQAYPRVLRVTLANVPSSPAASGGSGGSGGSASPQPGPDKTPPRAVLGGKKSQRLGKTVTVTARCGAEPCNAVSGGKLLVKLAASKGAKAKVRAYPLRGAKAAVKAGRSATLKLRLPRKSLRAAKRAVAASGTVRAKVHVRVSDAAGNISGPTSRVVKLS